MNDTINIHFKQSTVNDLLTFSELLQKDKIQVIPNQKTEGGFRCKKSLFKDDDIPEELKDVLLIMDSEADWRSDLIHNEITKCSIPDTQKRSTEVISSEIDKLIESKTSDQEN